jgi:streptomycin 6-kinase
MADLERCKPRTRLPERPEPDQDLVITGLLRRLWRPAPDGDRFRPPGVMCDQWAPRLRAENGPRSFQRRPGLAAEGIAAFRFLARPAQRHVLLCTDLHTGNVPGPNGNRGW